jgi:Arc/MetJ family transcription regulator
MATNLAIDETLLAEAKRISGRRTKRETVNEALAEYIQRRRQQEILALFGTIDFHPDYDPKQQRRRH